MRRLMISLDKKILEPNSAVARRMIEYGKEGELFIVVPGLQKLSINLGSNVRVESSGGIRKPRQLWELYILAKKICKTHGIELITTQDPFFLGLLGVWLKKDFRVPLEVQLHGDFFDSIYYRRSGLLNFVRYLLGRYVIVRADRIRVVGERIKQSALSLGVSEKNLLVRPISVNNTEIFNYQPKIDLHRRYPECKKIFLVLGRLDPVKNIPWLITIFTIVVRAHPEYGLLIAGDGPEREQLQDIVRLQALSKNIRFEGLTDNPYSFLAPSWTNDPWSYLKTADCLLFPSLSEGYGLVAMEAYAAGTPVIMNDVGVANYELKPSDKVKILPINDKEKWIKAILSV